MNQHAAVYVTQNFENNLDTIQQYFIDNEVPQQFDILIEKLFGTIIPNIETFPGIGKGFLNRQPGSVEGMNILGSIHQFLKGKGDIHEYITGDYLILYALIENNIYLLSSKHHRQLAFDFSTAWTDN